MIKQLPLLRVSFTQRKGKTIQWHLDLKTLSLQFVTPKNNMSVMCRSYLHSANVFQYGH